MRYDDEDRGWTSIDFGALLFIPSTIIASKAHDTVLYLGHSTSIRPHIAPTSPNSLTGRIIDSLYNLSSASYRPRPSLSHGNIMAHTYASDVTYFSLVRTHP